MLHTLVISADRYLDLRAAFSDDKLEALPAIEPNPKALEVESGQHGGSKAGQTGHGEVEVDGEDGERAAREMSPAEKETARAETA